MNRTALLDEANRLINKDRAASYGDSNITHRRVAAVWSALLNHPVSAHQVSLMMAGLKLVRAAHDPRNADSWIDLIGYAALGGENATEV